MLSYSRNCRDKIYKYIFLNVREIKWKRVSRIFFFFSSILLLSVALNFRERKNSEYNREQSLSRRNIWQMLRFERQKLRAPHSYFSRVEVIHANYIQFHTARPARISLHFLPHGRKRTNESLWIFQTTAARTIGKKRVFRSALLKSH